jgi:signal transduction histidine kinase
MTVGGENITARIHRTGRPARIDHDADASGEIGAHLRNLGTRSAVGCPIMVGGRLWGIMIAAQGVGEPLPTDTEARVGQFTELVATAISNVEARSELAASRARVVATSDEERRRVVRDLHDGAQQRLVHTVVMLKLASRALERGEKSASRFVSEALDHAEQANVELHELAHGILPAVLAQGGLRAGVQAVASRMQVPVGLSVSVGRLPAPAEATAYFVVAEALTNIAKHARARRAEVTAHVEDGTLQVHVRDDGVGGAQPEGSGLVGLRDRLAALDGRLRIVSPRGGGTIVTADIPLCD